MSNAKWIIWYEESGESGTAALRPAAWQLDDRGDVYTYPLDVDIRARWQYGDAMAYYPFSAYHC